MARIIGLTGNIACGKTAVGHMLLELGAERYIDADEVVHKLYDSGQPIALQVAAVFGAKVMAADGSGDRKALGTIVFQDTAALQRLEAIVHPAVGLALVNELAPVSETGIAIIDAVKLLEGSSGKFCQSKWLVICPEEQELARLMARIVLNAEEKLSRFLAGLPYRPSLLPVVQVIDNVVTFLQQDG